MRHSFRFIQNITTLYNIYFTKESFETLKLKDFEIKNIKLLYTINTNSFYHFIADDYLEVAGARDVTIPLPRTFTVTSTTRDRFLFKRQ